MTSTSCTEVGPGDFVKIGREWKRIVSNTAYGVDYSPRNWTIKTEDGQSYDMWSINAYAKQSEFPDDEVRRSKPLTERLKAQREARDPDTGERL